MLCGDLEEWGGGVGGRLKRDGDVHIHIADSRCCTAEMNTAM